MLRLLLFFLSIVVLGSCSPVEKHNRQLSRMHTVAQLKKDTDFAYDKLKKLHPQLYWYISKERLDFKFDSLKSTITTPMTALDYFKKLSPVIATIGQGHINLSVPSRIFTKAEQKAIAAKGVGPFSQFDFEFVGGKMYVVKNKSYEAGVVAGSELVAVNGIPTEELVRHYTSWFGSDGYNQTFKHERIAKLFPTWFSLEYGLQDSLAYRFKFHDSIQDITILRKVIDTTKPAPKPKVKKVKTKAEKEKEKALAKKKSVRGWDPSTGLYNRNLHFKEADSSVAVLTIRRFQSGNYEAFYKQAFEDIKKNKASTLIIDLRNNPGGRLDEIAFLYRFLADTAYVFSDRNYVRSKTSMLWTDYFAGSSIAGKVTRGIAAPLYYGFHYFNTRKDEKGNYYFASRHTKTLQPDPNSFKGKVYVLINGGSFSASSIISSNLKGSKRAYFVGDETGGAFNGTVAGRMPGFNLPHSNLKLRFGLMFIAAHYKGELDGRGIFPDKQIVPTLEDRIAGNDPEMAWVLQDIAAAKSSDLTEQQ